MASIHLFVEVAKCSTATFATVLLLCNVLLIVHIAGWWRIRICKYMYADEVTLATAMCCMLSLILSVRNLKAGYAHGQDVAQNMQSLILRPFDPHDIKVVTCSKEHYTVHKNKAANEPC
jgi:MFS superfamily sulfate permease-like transporter